MSREVHLSLFRWNGNIDLLGTTIWFWVEKIALRSQKVMWWTVFDTKFVYSGEGTMFG